MDNGIVIGKYLKFYSMWYMLQVLAGLLNMADRADWRNCSQSKEEETKMAEDFKNQFQEFDPNKWLSNNRSQNWYFVRCYSSVPLEIIKDANHHRIYVDILNFRSQEAIDQWVILIFHKKKKKNGWYWFVVSTVLRVFCCILGGKTPA